MKTAFLILLTIHGLIHLMGFATSFKIFNETQITQTISKPIGIAWLITTLLCLTVAFLFITKNNFWWLFGFAAIALSQFLIFCLRSDAKYGTLINFVILVVSFTGYCNWHYYMTFKNDVESGLQQQTSIRKTLLTESAMTHLPEVVKKYIRVTGCIGRPMVNNFRIEFKGKIRKDEQSAWMPFTSVQYNFIQSPTRLFFMKAVMKHLPVTGYHCYKNGVAFMDIRLFSFFKVQYEDGNEMNRAETVTFFNDMCCMAPATLIDKRIVWQELDENSVNATFTNNGISIKAHLQFNEAGQLVNFSSADRYNVSEGKAIPWSTPLKNYSRINGLNLAAHAETMYTYPDRELCYGIFDITDIKYNCNDIDSKFTMK